METVHTGKNDAVFVRLLQFSLPVPFHQCLLLKILLSSIDTRPKNCQFFAKKKKKKRTLRFAFRPPAIPPLSLFLFFKMMYITKHLCVFSTAFEVGKWRSITFTFLPTSFFLTLLVPMCSIIIIKYIHSSNTSTTFYKVATGYMFRPSWTIIISKCTKMKATCSYVRPDDVPRGPKHVACGYFVKGCRCVGRMYTFYDNYLLLLTCQQTK